MESPSTSSALAKRKLDDIARMPPPPVKRLKRPAKVLDEDDYTNALSEIIARDYFPGLLESRAQQEYLAALESNNSMWIAEASEKLKEAMAPLPSGSRRRTTRNSRFNTPVGTPRHPGNSTPVADTPRGWRGDETPISVAGTKDLSINSSKPGPDISTLSLSAFQAKYISEDNESFNAILDCQNQKRREKHAHMWTQDNKIPSARQIAHRVREAKLLAQRAEDEAAAAQDGTSHSLIPLTAGATDSRPAKPDTWHVKRPDNAFMFEPSSIDEAGLQTVAEVREASSKAGPKAVVHSNTRFTPQSLLFDGNPPSTMPPSPSLNTSIIARRDAARAAASDTSLEYPIDIGGETPRVNGYTFVEEDEPENLPQQEEQSSGPSYRDLLAGQTVDATPNPFRVGDVRKREDLHLRMVERVARGKREKEGSREGRSGEHSASAGGKGGMTPAARKLMERIGRTPVAGAAKATAEGREREMWTPGRTPRRGMASVKAGLGAR